MSAFWFVAYFSALVIGGASLGFFLAWIGWPLTTWQYWAILTAWAIAIWLLSDAVYRWLIRR